MFVSPDLPGEKSCQGLDALKTTGNTLNAYGKVMNTTPLYVINEPISYGLLYSGPLYSYDLYSTLANKIESFKLVPTSQ
jgi:hypothetical protein